MPRFLVDVNLPYRFGFWHGPEYVHLRDLDVRMPDPAIWDYARANDLVIVTKDADFSIRVMLSTPPPRVVHIRLGNVGLRGLHQRIAATWPWIVENVDRYALIAVWPDRIETVASPQRPSGVR